MPDDVDAFLGLLDGVRGGGTNQWSAKCPAHEDNQASLSVSVGSKGQLLTNCHAGCSHSDIVEAVGFTKPVITKANGAPLAVYDYVDEAGKCLFQVRRHIGRYSQHAALPDGTFAPRLGAEVRRVPYRLPELIQGVKDGRLIFVVEGEKDVETLRRHGRVATTNSGGANTEWPMEWANYFTGANVCVLGDNDPPGRKAQRERASLLATTARTVKVVDLPDVPDKGDITDWLEVMGHTDTELQELYRHAPFFTERKAGVEVIWGSQVEPEDVEWLWQDRIPNGKVTLIVGEPDKGKSFLTLALTAAVTKGGTLIGNDDPCDAGNVYLIAPEDDSASTIVPRANACGVDLARLALVEGYRDEEGLLEPMSKLRAAELFAHIEADKDARMLVIDPVMAFVGEFTNTNADNAVRGVMQPLVDLAERSGIAVVCVMHMKKGESDSMLNKIGGSVAFGAAARSVLFVGQDQQTGRRGIVTIKSNLAVETPPPIEFLLGPDGGVLFVGERPDMEAEHLISRPQDASAEARGAKAWLVNYLSDGPRRISEVMDAAEAEGFSREAIKKAKQRLKEGVHSFEPGGTTGKRGGRGSEWWWELSPLDGGVPPKIPEIPDTLEDF